MKHDTKRGEIGSQSGSRRWQAKDKGDILRYPWMRIEWGSKRIITRKFKIVRKKYNQDRKIVTRIKRFYKHEITQ